MINGNISQANPYQPSSSSLSTLQNLQDANRLQLQQLISKRLGELSTRNDFGPRELMDLSQAIGGACPKPGFDRCG